MFQTIMFLFLSSMSILNFTSQNDSQLRRSANWFKDIKYVQAAYLIIECHQTNHGEKIEGVMDFKQDAEGVLFAVLGLKIQKLGDFPNIKIQWNQATTEWYDDDKSTVRFLIPYRRITTQATSN